MWLNIITGCDISFEKWRKRRNEFKYKIRAKQGDNFNCFGSSNNITFNISCMQLLHVLFLFSLLHIYNPPLYLYSL